MQVTYILKDGWILLYRMSEQGERLVFPPVLPGEIIGIHKDHNTKSPFSALALQDCVVCKVPKLEAACHADSAMA